MASRNPPKPDPRILDHSDPQRGRWGGIHQNNGRRLEARLLDSDQRFFCFDLSVSSADGTRLRGPVRFHLHDSFPCAIQNIRRISNDGTLCWNEISAYETFTAAAQVQTDDGNWVGLEYDLAMLAVDGRQRTLPLKFVPNRDRAFVRWLRGRRYQTIPGIILKDIYSQIVSAFRQPAELSHELKIRLNFDISTIVNEPTPSDGLVFSLFQWADKQGRLGELVCELAGARPQHMGIQTIVREYGGLLTAADPRTYIPNFGVGPVVDVQVGGVKEGIVSVQDAGFEVTRNKALGYFDAAFFAEMLARMARRVCRVELNDIDNVMGTAFLVGPQVVLTNYHVLEKVIANRHAANLVKFRFDYFRSTPDSMPSDGIQLGLDSATDVKQPWLLSFARYSSGEKVNSPDNPPPTPHELDYVLVRLERAIGSETSSPIRGWIELQKSPPSLADAPLLMILQHPEREPIKLAFDSNPKAEIKFGGLRVRYQVNTDPGSSGSPVFDREWRLAALHHYGDPSWKTAFNQGIPVGQIYMHLSQSARQQLGDPIETLPRLEVATDTTAALSERFGTGIRTTREDVEGIIRDVAEAAVANPLSSLANLGDREQQTIADKIKASEDEWEGIYRNSDDEILWQDATDRKKRKICHLLRIARNLNGGKLPLDWVKRWEALGCDKEVDSPTVVTNGVENHNSQIPLATPTTSNDFSSTAKKGFLVLLVILLLVIVYALFLHIASMNSPSPVGTNKTQVNKEPSAQSNQAKKKAGAIEEPIRSPNEQSDSPIQERPDNKATLVTKLNKEHMRIARIQDPGERYRALEVVVDQFHEEASQSDLNEEIIAFVDLYKLMAFESLSLTRFSEALTALNKQQMGLSRVYKKNPLWQPTEMMPPVAAQIAFNRLQSVFAAIADQRGLPKDVASLDDDLRISMTAISKLKPVGELERATVGMLWVSVCKGFLATKNYGEASRTLQKVQELLPQESSTNGRAINTILVASEYHLLNSFLASKDGRIDDASKAAEEAKAYLDFLDSDSRVPKKDTRGVLGFVYLHMVRCAPPDLDTKDRLDTAINFLQAGDGCASCMYNLACAYSKKAELTNGAEQELIKSSHECLSKSIEDLMTHSEFWFIKADTNLISADPFLKSVLATDEGKAILQRYSWVKRPIPLQLIHASNGLLFGEFWHFGVPNDFIRF